MHAAEGAGGSWEAPLVRLRHRAREEVMRVILLALDKTRQGRSWRRAPVTQGAAAGLSDSEERRDREAREEEGARGRRSRGDEDRAMRCGGAGRRAKVDEIERSGYRSEGVRAMGSGGARGEGARGDGDRERVRSG